MVAAIFNIPTPTLFKITVFIMMGFFTVMGLCMAFLALISDRIETRIAFWAMSALLISGGPLLFILSNPIIGQW